MKISNKLLIGLLTTIFIVITAAFIDIRVFGVHRSANNPAKKTYNFDLGSYRYLKAVNVPSLEIRPSTKNHLNFIAYNDTTEFAIDHRIENDTLFLIGKKDYHSHYSLYTKSDIEFISSKDSRIEFKSLKQNKMGMILDGGEVYCWNGDSKRISKFGKLKIDQINSLSNLHNVKTDTLDINLVKSQASFVKEILVLKASVKDKSNLQLRNVSDVKFIKDKSSKVNFY